MARRVRQPIEELEHLQNANTSALAQDLAAIAAAGVRGNYSERDRLVEQLGAQLGEIMAAADLFGRRRLMSEADAVLERSGARTFARGARRARVPFLPNIPFREAIEDILERDPRLAVGWRATQRAYVDGGFAAARAASETIAGQIQQILETAIRRGTDQKLAEDRIVRALRSGNDAEARAVGVNPAGWTRAYADTVFRTNVASSYARGRREQAKAPGVSTFMGGWRFTAVGDSDSRRNHAAADGLLAPFDDPIWSQLSPPLGYRCRCSLELVTKAEMRASGLLGPGGEVVRRASIPAGARADPGFVAGGGPL